MTETSSLKVRHSGNLVQVLDVARGEALLCVDVAASTLITLVVTELNIDDSQKVMLALDALREVGVFSSDIRVLRFSNIGSATGERSDHNRTVWRHDQICKIVGLFVARTSSCIDNAYLTPRGATLDTVIFLKR